MNTNVHTLGDTLYWSFLTLTGVGQPFEVVTTGGKVSTVISIFVAITVLPGQIAKIASLSQGKVLLEMEREMLEVQTIVSSKHTLSF